MHKVNQVQEILSDIQVAAKQFSSPGDVIQICSCKDQNPDLLVDIMEVTNTHYSGVNNITRVQIKSLSETILRTWLGRQGQDVSIQVNLIGQE